MIPCNIPHVQSNHFPWIHRYSKKKDGAFLGKPSGGSVGGPSAFETGPKKYL